MPWLRIDDRVRTHPKIVRAGPDASWFWFCGICYCREHLTDGFIPKGMLASLCPGVGISAARRFATTLVASLLWHDVPDGYRVHDFLDWNPSRASVLEKRKDEKERKDRERHKDEVSDTDKTRTTRGQNEDTPQSVRADTSRGGAIARGSGLGYGSDLGSSVLEKSPRETFSSPSKKSPALIMSSLEFDRKHGAMHVTEFCDWVCFPNDLRDDFAKRVTGVSFDVAHGQVLEWAREIRQQWHGRIVPDGSIWDFWKHRWTETHGGSKPSSGLDPLAGIRALRNER